MQSRFYSPDLRRFINADLLHGDITNSLTLNRYAYCNGDPVNGIDPLGLSKEQGDFGILYHNGIDYPIYVPELDKGVYFTTPTPWKTVDSVEVDMTTFNSDRFFENLSTTELEDFDGILTGTDANAGSHPAQNIIGLGCVSVGMSLVSLFSGTITNECIKVVFQEKDNRRRAIIYAGSSEITEKYNTFANDRPIRLQLQYNGYPLAQAILSKALKEKYAELTGCTVDGLFTRFDMSITLDSRHKDKKYSSYLWIGEDGVVIQTPITYDNDKVQIGTTGYFGFFFDALYTVPLDGSIIASDNYKSMLSSVIANNRK